MQSTVIKNSAFIFFVFLSQVVSAQSLSWSYLIQNQENKNCVSNSNCDENGFCYGIVYTPVVTGEVTSYTLGFQGNCLETGSQYSII